MSTHTSLVSTGIQFPDGTTQTTRAAGEFSSGVVMVFYQASAPTGWTKSTSHNNKALRVVSSTGGGSGGSWNLSSGVTSSSTGSHTHTFSDSSSTTSSNGSHAHSTSSHTLSSSQIPSHNHTIPKNSFACYGGTTQYGIITLRSHATTVNSGSTGSGSSHTHGNTSSTGNHTHTVGVSGTTGSVGNHTHTITAPKYIDVIVCSKD